MVFSNLVMGGEFKSGKTLQNGAKRRKGGLANLEYKIECINCADLT
jgi:hypothetical protein